jgi:hypothetical protein
MMTTADDARMVAELLGLTEDDAPDVQEALDDVVLLGQDGFEDRTLADAATALQLAYAGQRPTAEIIRRAQVRRVIATALREFTELRASLTNYVGPKH